ncbi:hypothetical protein P692DRAFT_20860284 [Suillus brevipes Sb2]|nr:hypothetical protein P692DRAFT_20860284 [Suillus brevipes Sb2]
MTPVLLETRDDEMLGGVHGSLLSLEDDWCSVLGYPDSLTVLYQYYQVHAQQLVDRKLSLCDVSTSESSGYRSWNSNSKKIRAFVAYTWNLTCGTPGRDGSAEGGMEQRNPCSGIMSRTKENDSLEGALNKLDSEFSEYLGADKCGLSTRPTMVALV